MLAAAANVLGCTYRPDGEYTLTGSGQNTNLYILLLIRGYVTT